MGRLDGKVAIITGGARGIGATTARRFIAEGARVVLGDIRDELGQATAKDLGEAAVYRHLDVTSEQDWADIVAFTVSDVGPLNVLMNNAGLSRLSKLEETSVELFRRIMDVNALGTFLGIRSAAAAMRQAGGGSIINISSVAGHFVAPRVAAYAASKFAIRGITKVAALELGRDGIRVNAICPSRGSQDMLMEAVPPELLQAIAARAASAGGKGTASAASLTEPMEQVASAAVFLASDESVGFNGADFNLDGGATVGDVSMGGLEE